MKKHLRYKTSVFTVSVLLIILSALPVFAQSDKASPPANLQNFTVGAFTANVPADWTRFSESDMAGFNQQYKAQSEAIFSQYGVNDTRKSVDTIMFYIPNDADSFFGMVSSTLPPQADLITLLKSQIGEKMAWGVREGYIRKYIGLVTVDDKQFSGFYTKAIGNSGGVEISGGGEHKKLKNTVIQLTLICPKSWDEAKAISTFTSILKSIMLN